MIKIISGEFKGRLIKSPYGIRPILAQIKKSVFDILKPYIADALFLDLYAGSGAVGLEALSRGAKFCVFVEREKNVLKILSENVVNLDCQQRCYIIKADVLKDLIWVEKAKKILSTKYGKSCFDIIYIGAPYISAKKNTLANLSTATIEIIENSNILSYEGTVIIQHIKKEKISTKKLLLVRQKFYGDTIVSFFKYNS
ncbi:MAG: 16S rRNA (guanine(966)-N(2))-methyltransferase RsmD [Endomicrobia bacterium]|nr:16S rRNA (guanine(966)-N(2))-methyltransferase RsmD [Endomicrobiia bacterium]